MHKPIMYDIFCGLGGWAEGGIAEGYDVIGFDVERHDYGTGGYPGQLVLQDVCTIHGAQLKDAAVIVASPPCQEFSYRAMPWKRAKALPPPVLGINLFWQCWRIQHEASEARGEYIPLVVENVVGAQRWVGTARWHYRSFYLWGDIPSLMPIPQSGQKNTGGSWFGQRDGQALERNDPRDMRRNDAGEFVNAAATGGWNHPGKVLDGTKQGGDWFSDPNRASRTSSSRSTARKAASAQIAKIPFPLAQHIAMIYKVGALEASSV